LVLDPCYAGSVVEAQARALPVRLEWHSGFSVTIQTIRSHSAYRGERYVELASSLTTDDVLTPALIGRAAAAGRYEPDDLKKVWHYLARFGAPREVNSRPSRVRSPGQEERWR
jgi:hypothetical protein